MDIKSSLVYAIGKNEYGEFGVDNTTTITELTPLKWSNNINIIDIANGYLFTIYKDDKNRLFVAGNNKDGSCMQDVKGDGKIISLSMVNGLQNLNISNIYCNPVNDALHAFIITNDNKLYGFGNNDCGQLGIGNKENMYKLVNIKWTYGIITQIQCAAFYSIILTQNGNVYSTDFSMYGGNGQAEYTGSKTWRKVNELKNIKRIATGGYHTLCCDNNGNVYSFGNNEKGQLGINKKDNDKHSKPILIPFFQQKHIVIVDVACGDSFSLALSKGGKVFAFGNNSHGECGQGYESDEPLLIPTQIQSLNDINIKKIICGCYHSAAISNRNQIYLFGYNGYNECVIESYNPSKDKPILINEYIYNKAKKNVILIQLGFWNTKLILSNNSLNETNLKENEFKEEKKSNETNNNNNNKEEVTNEIRNENIEFDEQMYWNCLVCTYKNSNKNEICAMCESGLNPNSNVNVVQKNKIESHKKLKKEQDGKNKLKQQLEFSEKERMKLAKEKEENEKKLKEKLEKEERERIKLEREKEEMEQKLNEWKEIKELKEEKEEKEIKNDNNEINLESLLTNWNLGQYINTLITDQGYEDIEDCIDLTLTELMEMGFKPGHAKKLKRKINESVNEQRNVNNNNNVQHGNDNDNGVEGRHNTDYM